MKQAKKRYYKKVPAWWGILKNQPQQYHRTRTLKAGWTIEQAIDLESWYNIELEEETVKQLVKEIDAEILKELKCQTNQETQCRDLSK